MPQMQEFRAFSRRYRNRRIGEFLKEMHLTEGRNTGFCKIRNALHNNGSPEPLFETDDECTYFSTTLYIHPDFNYRQFVKHKNDGNDGNHDGNTELTELETVILNLLKSRPEIVVKQIADAANVSKSTVERVLRKLKEERFIKRQGGTRGVWVVLK